MKRRFLALLLSLVMVFSFTAPAYAEGTAIDNPFAIENTEETRENTPGNTTEEITKDGDSHAFDEDEQTPDESEETLGEGEQTPGESEQTPGEGEQTPSESEQTPSESEQTPSESEQTPGEGEQTPGEGEQTPSESEQTPGEGEQIPGESEQTPGEGEQTPGEGEQTPSESEQTPGESEQQTPSEGEQQTPGESEQTPSVGEQTPGESEQQTPNEGEQNPGEDAQRPAVTGPVCPGNDTCTIKGCQNHNPSAPVLFCNICGVAILDETTKHAQNCITVAVCEICGKKQDHFTEDCAFYAPVTAEVYTEVNGIYTEFDGHGKDAPVDVGKYDGRTIYVLESNTAQNVYFKHGTFIGIGVGFKLTETEYAMMSTGGAWIGDSKAVVTLAADTPADTEIILTADMGMFGNQSVTIKVIDEIPVKEPEASMDNFELSVEGLPDNISLEITNEIDSPHHRDLEQYVDSDSELLYVFDITPLYPDGTLWQPESGQSATITVDFKGMGLPDGNTLNVLHEHGDELKELGEYTLENGKLTFSTTGFSKFYFYITYTFGEHSYTMSGGSSVHLSEILQTLGISYDIDDVAAVDFTNPDALKITCVGSDWELESLTPFGSEEILTIVFADGEVIEVPVKDPVVYNYAVGPNITNVPMLETIQRTVASVDNGDKAALGKTYTVNKEQITVENVQAAGVAEKTAGVHPAPDAKHMIIYATEGMAIDFIGGTDWTYAGSKPTAAGNEIWFWSWESPIKANYAIVKDGSAGQQAMFTVTTTVNGTKYYCNVVLCVVEDSRPNLLKDNLPNGYSIKNVPVTLYNYDGKAFNEYYNSKGGNYFAFSGTSMGVASTTNAGNRGWTSSGLQANGGGGVALMGIMQDELANGLPVTSQGQKVDLFSSNTLNGAKEVYENVGFQFIYNEETGYYSYNSALNHAQYNSSTNEIELYEESLAPSDTPAGDSHGNAGFYPFEDIDDAFTNTGYTAMTTSEWENKLERNAFELIPSQYSTDIALTSATNSTADMHYGLQVKSAFYLPEGKVLNGQEMIYEFTGDDDLWIYIDGRLVLDIGGGHTFVSGSFNLTTGEVWVEKYTQLAAADGGSYGTRAQGTDLRYTDNFLTSLEDDQMHTIQIFYLERHGGVSNCRMHFNLPLAPMNAVEVSKTLVNQAGDTLSVTPDVEYTFQIFTAEDDDDIVDAENFLPLANKSFFGGKTTDADGKFTLKAGETARFDGIPRFAEVRVIEIAPNDGYVYTNSKVSVNGTPKINYVFGQSTPTQIVQSNEAMSFDFTNYMQTQPLTIEKQVVNGTAGLIDPLQEFTFTLDFTREIVETGGGAIKANNSVNLSDNGTFQLGHDESVTIPRVPVGMTFKVKEKNAGDSFDNPVFTATRCTSADNPVSADYSFDQYYHWKMADGGENKIAVTNQQRFTLTITKSGVQNVDQDSDEQQSTIYTVVGKIGDDVIAKVDVAICGNDSVTICKLPVGSYTVEENTDWAWRYIPDNSATKEVDIVPETASATVNYKNSRSKTHWLSGDCYVENWFTSGEIKKRNGLDEVIE